MPLPARVPPPPLTPHHPSSPACPRHPPSPHVPFPPASARLFLKCLRPLLGALIWFPFRLDCPSNETLKCHPQSWHQSWDSVSVSPSFRCGRLPASPELPPHASLQGFRTTVVLVPLGSSRSQPPVLSSKMLFPCKVISQIIWRKAVPFVTEFLTCGLFSDPCPPPMSPSCVAPVSGTY